MANLTRHGGMCCGINHLYGFHTMDTEESIRAVVEGGTRQHRTQGMLVEAVLTNRQLNAMPNLAEALQKVGFKLVSRFKNPNSGNICNVFHYNAKPRSTTTRLPFKILKEVP